MNEKAETFGGLVPVYYIEAALPIFDDGTVGSTLDALRGAHEGFWFYKDVEQVERSVAACLREGDGESTGIARQIFPGIGGEKVLEGPAEEAPATVTIRADDLHRYLDSLRSALKYVEKSQGMTHRAQVSLIALEAAEFATFIATEIGLDG